MSLTGHVPLPRVAPEATTAGRAVAGAQTSPARGLRGWAGAIWRRYVRLSVSADPALSTVWIHGHCLDVSIYDRDWPESYLY